MVDVFSIIALDGRHLDRIEREYVQVFFAAHAAACLHMNGLDSKLNKTLACWFGVMLSYFRFLITENTVAI
jgi:hypothetical protein